MDLNDFKGIHYFRILLPALFILSWVSSFAGPLFFTLAYRKFCFLVHVHVLLKAIYQFALTISLCIKGNAALDRAQNPPKYLPLQLSQHQQIYHAIVIPNYKEDIEILAETIQVLAQHTRAISSYLIFLAMEEHQKDSDLKAQQLMSKFQGKFRSIDFTVHKIRPHEQKGKASNVSWCVEHMEEKFQNLMISYEDVFVTVMDADSWAPNAYFNEVQNHLFSNFENRYLFMFQPNQIFARNSLEVPTFVRTYQDTHSWLHAAINSGFGDTFSLSNYTMSYSLIKRVGYWDTVEEAIAEDLHMNIKTYFKTRGQLKTIPIFTPFNQLSIHTGKGYFQDIKAKFWQLQRHGRGLMEIGYCTLMFFRYLTSLRSFFFLLFLLQSFIMPIVAPYCVISIQVQDQIFGWDAPTEGLLKPVYFVIMFNLANALGIIMILIYDYYKRKSSKQLWGIEGPSLWRVIEAPLSLFINLVLVMNITFMLSSVNMLKSNSEYVVADKKSKNTKIVQNLAKDSINNSKIFQFDDQSDKLLT